MPLGGLVKMSDISDLVINCDHELVVQTGVTDKETTNDYLDGVPHYYLNCLICSTTLLRDDTYLRGYQDTGYKIPCGKLYRRKDNEQKYL